MNDGQLTIHKYNLMTQTIFTFKRISLSILFLIALSFTVKAQQVISLQKAVDLTIQNNLTIKQAQLTESLANDILSTSHDAHSS